MKKRKKDPTREDRIHNEAIVDAYGPEERAMGWYYYLENQLRFPFQARCTVSKVVSPLGKGETVQVLCMAPEETAPPICSCSSAGKAGHWRFPYPNWQQSRRTNQPPTPSATGIIGSLQGYYPLNRAYGKAPAPITACMDRFQGEARGL